MKIDLSKIYPIPAEPKPRPKHAEPQIAPRQDYYTPPVRADSDPASNMIRLKLAALHEADQASPSGSTFSPPTEPLDTPLPAELLSGQPPDSPLTGQTVSNPIDPPPKNLADIKQQLLASVRSGSGTSRSARWRPLLTALIAGLSFLFVSYNQIALAQIRQYISPGSSLTTPIIIDPSASDKIGKDPRVLIPKINVDVPVVYDVTTYDEAAIQAGLERGVVHYGTTALPGEIGNNVIVGHSSNNFFNAGKYKFAFVLLSRVEKGDTFILQYKGKRYVYKVFNRQIIEPNDFSLIQPTSKPVATLITCDPPGTSWRRLVVQGEQISPDPKAAAPSQVEAPQEFETPLPSNAPSLWDRIF